MWMGLYGFHVWFCYFHLIVIFKLSSFSFPVTVERCHTNLLFSRAYIKFLSLTNDVLVLQKVRLFCCQYQRGPSKIMAGEAYIYLVNRLAHMKSGAFVFVVLPSIYVSIKEL